MYIAYVSVSVRGFVYRSVCVLLELKGFWLRMLWRGESELQLLVVVVRSMAELLYVDRLAASTGRVEKQ